MRAFPLLFLFAIVLLVVVVAVVALVVAFAKRRNGGMAVAAVVGVVLFVSVSGLLMILGFVFTARMSHVPPSSHATSSTLRAERAAPSFMAPAPATSEPSPAVHVAQAGWQHAAAQHFDADVYPSMKAASAGLARQLSDRLATMENEPSGLTVVMISDSPAQINAADAAKAAILDAMPAIGPVQRKRSADDQFDDAHERLTVRYDETTVGDGVRWLNWQLGDGAAELSTAIRDKPWVDDPNWSPNVHLGWPGVVGHSDGLFADPTEAERSAVLAAARQIRETLPVPASSGTVIDVDQQALAVRDVIYTGDLVRDRFLQRIDRPYGHVYRAAVLVQAGSTHWQNYNAAVQAADQHAVATIISKRKSIAHQVLSVGALVVLIVLVYALLNTLTKHYYLWQLRAAALFAVVVGLLAILLRIGSV